MRYRQHLCSIPQGYWGAPELGTRDTGSVSSSSELGDLGGEAAHGLLGTRTPILFVVVVSLLGLCLGSGFFVVVGWDFVWWFVLFGWGFVCLLFFFFSCCCFSREDAFLARRAVRVGCPVPPSPPSWSILNKQPPSPRPRVTSARRARSKGCYHVGRVIKTLMNECL